MESRKVMMKSSPAAWRIRRTISVARLRRPAGVPPQASVRRLVRGERNWSMRYPSEPMISTPS